MVESEVPLAFQYRQLDGSVTWVKAHWVLVDIRRGGSTSIFDVEGSCGCRSNMRRLEACQGHGRVSAWRVVDMTKDVGKWHTIR